ncbi:MAG: hypothetical protein U9N33_10555 [Campylobacterota bacterium]|nr:hypothetical protein [Campylobacterota bacterium]
MSISSNISSIQSHQTMMSASANNIANANTDNYIPTSTTMQDNGNSVSANSRKADDNGSKASQTNLSKELPDQIIVQDMTAANVAAIKTQDDMLGTLLDLKA